MVPYLGAFTPRAGGLTDPRERELCEKVTRQGLGSSIRGIHTPALVFFLLISSLCPLAKAYWKLEGKGAHGCGPQPVSP